MLTKTQKIYLEEILFLGTGLPLVAKLSSALPDFISYPIIFVPITFLIVWKIWRKIRQLLSKSLGPSNL